MPRLSGSKVVPCPKKGCDGRIVALVGKRGTCAKCGEQVMVSKKLLKELGKL